MVEIASTGYGQLRIRRLTYCGTLRRGRVIATRTLVDGGKMHSKHHTVKPQPVRPPTTLGPDFPHIMRLFAGRTRAVSVRSVGPAVVVPSQRSLYFD